MPRRDAVSHRALNIFATLAATLAIFLTPRAASAQSFDYYILALSWSPSWCADKGDARGSEQCTPGANPGFVVHGLWPAQADGSSPTECGPQGRNPTRMALDTAAQVFPSIGLARYQWRKHGTCSGLDPQSYFSAVKQARSIVNIPAPLVAPDRTLQTNPLSVERAFSDANPGLRADMIQVSCRRDSLTEVRLCIGRDLKSFVTCPAIQRSDCRARDISIPAGR